MTILHQCQRTGCEFWARWSPVLLFHRSVGGAEASPPASVKIPLELCDDHHAEAQQLDDVLEPDDCGVLDQHFIDANREPPDWAFVELTWDCNP